MGTSDSRMGPWTRRRVYSFLGIAIITIAARLVGEWVRTTALIVVGVCALVIAFRYDRLKRRITEYLAARSEPDQDAHLVWLESWRDRPEILENLGRQGPRVPLRGEREVFRHEPHAAAAVRWTYIWTACFFALLVDIAVLRPPADPAQWPYLLALIAVSLMALICLPKLRRLYSEQVEVTEAALEIVRPTGERSTLPWTAIRDARDSMLRQELLIRAEGAVVRIPHNIVDYGRLANLIATRLPAGVAWRSG